VTLLEPVFKVLLEIAAKAVAKPVADKLGRRERVVALLKRFKLEPDIPPRDFNGLYTYALIEHCYEKPEPIIEFFRNEFVRDAFRLSFETGDPRHLDQEAEEVIRWNDETGKLGRIDYDFRREFAGFTAVFNALVDRTRGAAEARSERKLDHLETAVADVSERVAELPSLEDIRKITNVPAAGQLDPAAWLATEAKAWFDAIGYRFESYQEPTRDSFTWILNVPARRGRYDRVVVYGMAGEAGALDVEHVRALVDSQRADEGWLLVPRRVSAAAYEAAKADDAIACYTMDSLIDEDADFTAYLCWLDSEVERRRIQTKYVPVYCGKNEYDGAGRTSATSVYGEEAGGLDGYVRGWLTDPSKEHLSVLGEFGTGKTWFCLRLAWELANEYREAKERGLPRPRLPLVIPLRDYAKAVSVESLFSEFFFRKHEVQIAGYSVFDYLNRSGRLLLIFDGFDEMASRVDRQARVNNFWELAKVVVPGSKVLLTCRTEHFPEAKESRDLLGAKLRASTQALSGEPPQFEVVDLRPFDDDQVRQLLGNVTDPGTVDVVMDNDELLDLMRRPVMSEVVTDALPEISEGRPVDLARVYLYAVRRKMSRDIKAERTFTSMGDKLFFLSELSWEMLSTETMSMNYRHFPDRIRACFGAVVAKEKDLDHWHYDMLGQSMLIRNADGDYSPAHRSLLEFFVAYKFAAELGLLHQDFLDLVREEERPDRPMVRWSDAFYRTDQASAPPPISSFAAEPLYRLADTFGERPLDFAVVELIRPMLDRDAALGRLRDLVDSARGETARALGFVGGNAATLLVQLNPEALNGADLSGAHLAHASLMFVNLTGADLTEANLSNTNLLIADLTEANLTEADLSGADLTDAYLTDATLTRADLSNANLTDAYLASVDLTDADLSGADLGGAELRGADLGRADLTGAELRGANLTDANLRGAIFTDAHLGTARISRDCGLSDGDLSALQQRGVTVVD
jgi:uncharacterized protein YjbI with pentapeptide repeats